MDFIELTDAFRFDLDNLVDRYLREFDINSLTVIGCLHEKMIELSQSGYVDFEVDPDFFEDDEE